MSLIGLTRFDPRTDLKQTGVNATPASEDGAASQTGASDGRRAREAVAGEWTPVVVPGRTQWKTRRSTRRGECLASRPRLFLNRHVRRWVTSRRFTLRRLNKIN